MKPGICEVHIIVKPEDEVKLFGFVTNLKSSTAYSGLIRPRVTMARSLYGSHPVQPMLTFCISSLADPNRIADDVYSIWNDMKLAEMTVGRVKVEASAHNDGVLTSTPPPESHYFEFHAKVPIAKTDDWNTIAKICIKHGSHLFFNSYKTAMIPILTLRRYASLTTLESDFAQLQDELAGAGFPINSIEKEYSVLDTDVSYDEGWLYTGHPSNFIVDLTPKMMFGITV